MTLGGIGLHAEFEADSVMPQANKFLVRDL